MVTDPGFVPMPPPKKTVFRRGLLVQCPACGGRNNFERWFRMKTACPSCGLVFERMPGHWTGSLGISIILTWPLLAFIIVIGLIVTAPDFKVWTIIAVAVGFAVIFPILIFPLTRTLWTAIDIMMRPMRADEVDWSVAGRTPTSTST